MASGNDRPLLIHLTMIELLDNRLVFTFPEVHEDARLEINFQRTLRIPDDENTYPLPPGLGSFPLRHVDDLAPRVPEAWLRRGGVMLPMYQAEAMWVNFLSPAGYPFAVKIAAGKINAVTGEPWDEGLSQEPQNYMPLPEQPWLDGYVVEKGVIRQFVAMPLGSGYSAEEQLTGRAEHGGVQIQVIPLKSEHYRPRQMYFGAMGLESFSDEAVPFALACAPDMGLAAGGQMSQEIFEDKRPLEHYEPSHSSRCFVHLTNALVWRAITGEQPPTTPPTSAEYARAGLPWFDYYAADQRPISAQDALRALKSVRQLAEQKGDAPLPENEGVSDLPVVRLGSKPSSPNQVREGAL